MAADTELTAQNLALQRARTCAFGKVFFWDREYQQEEKYANKRPGHLVFPSRGSGGSGMCRWHSVTGPGWSRGQRGLARTGRERGNAGSSAAPALPGTPPPPCRGCPGQRCRPSSTRGRYLEERGGPAALREQHEVAARARLQTQPGAAAAGARPAQREALAQGRHLGQLRLSRELAGRARPREIRSGAGSGQARRCRDRERALLWGGTARGGG